MPVTRDTPDQRDLRAALEEVTARRRKVRARSGNALTDTRPELLALERAEDALMAAVVGGD